MTQILFLTPDRVGDRMAGPAIRAFELCRILARDHPVTLASPFVADPGTLEVPEGLRLRQLTGETLGPMLDDAGVVILQGMLLERFPALGSIDRPTVVDLYDPVFFEVPLTDRHRDPARRAHTLRRVLGLFMRQIALGDHFLVSSNRQRDFYLGMITALGLLDPEVQDRMAGTADLIGLVPFGHPPGTPPRLAGAGSFGPAIPPGAGVLLWPGGLWDWLDPGRLVEALARLSPRHPDLHAVFWGARHPNPEVPLPRSPSRLLDQARAAGLADRVHVVEDWVPYDRRMERIGAARVAVCLAPPTLESHLAYRSRVLDCLWAGVPLVVSGGDPLARTIRRHRLGEVARPGSTRSLVGALERALNPAYASTLPPADAPVRRRFTWDHAARPLQRFCAYPRRRPGRRAPDPALLGRLIEDSHPLTALSLRAQTALARHGLLGCLERLVGLHGSSAPGVR